MMCAVPPSEKAYVGYILRSILKQLPSGEQVSCVVVILHTKHLPAKGTHRSPFWVSTLWLDVSIAVTHSLTNGVGRCLLPLLVHAVVTCYSPVGSLCFYRLAIWTDQHAGHHAKRAITCKRQSMEYWLQLHGEPWVAQGQEQVTSSSRVPGSQTDIIVLFPHLLTSGDSGSDCLHSTLVLGLSSYCGSVF